MKNVSKFGNDQYKNFSKECIIEKKKLFHDTIKQDNLPLFEQRHSKNISKNHMKFRAAKIVECKPFSQLYIECQNRDGNLLEFFSRSIKLVQLGGTFECNMTGRCPCFKNLRNLFGKKIACQYPLFRNYQIRKQQGKQWPIVLKQIFITCSGIFCQFFYPVQEFRLKIDTLIPDG